MKNVLIILFVSLSIDLYCQIESRKDWSESIQKEFDFFKSHNIDTLLVYYKYMGTWTNLPDSCNSIPSVSVLWCKNNFGYTRNFYCDSSMSKTIIQISLKPFRYFSNHIEELKQKDRFIKDKGTLPSIPTDGSWEYLIFMTKSNQVILNLSEYQKSSNIWKQFVWVKKNN